MYNASDSNTDDIHKFAILQGCEKHNKDRDLEKYLRVIDMYHGEVEISFVQKLDGVIEVVEH